MRTTRRSSQQRDVGDAVGERGRGCHAVLQPPLPRDPAGLRRARDERAGVRPEVQPPVAKRGRQLDHRSRVNRPDDLERRPEPLARGGEPALAREYAQDASALVLHTVDDTARRGQSTRARSSHLCRAMHAHNARAYGNARAMPTHAMRLPASVIHPGVVGGLWNRVTNKEHR